MQPGTGNCPPYGCLWIRRRISRALGLKKPVGVLALTDKGFADAVRRQCRDEIEEVTAL